MRTDDRFTTVSVIAVLVATAALFAVVNTGGPPAPPIDVVHESVPRVQPLAQPAADPWSEAAGGASLAILDEGITIPRPAAAEPDGRPGLVAAAEAVLAARAPDTALPSDTEVTVRVDRDGRLVVAAGTMRRYRPLVDELEGFETGVVEAAGQGCDGRLLAALDRLLAVEIPEVEPTMVRRGIRWGFADPAYEALDDAQRHLLLMGRDQHRRVRAKLLELRAALGPCAVFADPDGTLVTEALAPSAPALDPDVLPPVEPASAEGIALTRP